MPDTLSNSEVISAEQHKIAVCACTRMFNDLKILDHSGHVSIRLPDSNNFLMQGIEASRSQLVPGDLFTVSLDGEVLDGPAGTRPAAEFHIHSEIYKARPEINSVLHAHPKVPVLFTIAEGAELKIVVNHGYRWRNSLPVHPDTGHINTSKLGTDMVATMGDANAVLLRAHGIVLASEDVKCLLIDGIHFDENAQACLEASRLGPPIAMNDEELDIFQERFSRSNHGRKLWHYYSTRAIENGVLPEEWRDAV
jgi:ribulose-5-phosphate 4-epimerase/fuculose-1-phosphate aldolase